MRKELLIGCGHNLAKQMYDTAHPEWEGRVTLDINPRLAPDICHDLTRFPYPMLSNEYDEIHAYEVLEHTGRQGDYAFFFAQWSEFWRILKPGGMFFATCPSIQSRWAWGDPSHTRVLMPEQLAFLSQKEYVRQREMGTAMSDFRYMYSADFDIVGAKEDADSFRFVLRAVKE